MIIKLEDIVNKFSHTFAPNHGEIIKIDWEFHKVELRHFMRTVKFDDKLNLYYDTIVNEYMTPVIIYYVNLLDIEKVKKYYDNLKETNE